MRSQDSRKRNGFTLIEMLIVVAIIGLLASVGVPYLLGAMDNARQKKIVADLRQIAQGVEAYQIAEAHYPVSNNLTPIETLDPVAMGIQPRYMERVPLKDGWGGFYYYQTDPAGNVSYTLMSYGKDKKASSASSGIIHDFNCDIIFRNGVFTSYPEGTQT